MPEKSSTIMCFIYAIWRRLSNSGILLKLLLLTSMRVGSVLKWGETFCSCEILLGIEGLFFFPAEVSFYVKHMEDKNT